MRILLVTYIYRPDMGPSARMFSDLCEQLTRIGYEVTVVTTVPHFPSGIVHPAYRNGLIHRTRENDVEVVRIRIPSIDRSGFLNRAIQFIVFQLLASIVAVKESADVAIVTNPSINKGLPFLTISRLLHRPSIFVVSDVYPDVGVVTGIFQSEWLIKLIEAMESYCLGHADIVWTFSNSFSSRLISLGASPERLLEQSVWVDTSSIRPMPKKNSFSRQHSLDDKFVLLYAGNLGMSQGLEDLLPVAKRLASLPDFVLLFVGEGNARNQLIDRANEMNLSNVMFLPFQPWAVVPEVMATADVSLVSLKPVVGLRSLPSKTFTYLASGRPILALVDEDSAIWNLIQRSKSGICIPFGDSDIVASKTFELYQNPKRRRELGRNARIWAEKYCSVESAACRVVEMSRKAIDHHTTA